MKNSLKTMEAMTKAATELWNARNEWNEWNAKAGQCQDITQSPRPSPRSGFFQLSLYLSGRLKMRMKWMLRLRRLRLWRVSWANKIMLQPVSANWAAWQFYIL